MKRFDTFGEYMSSLLFGPLKRGKRAVNQFRIFFRVIGRIFDGMKEDAFRVRLEASIATASPIMLPVHGQDREMPRLEGETVEAYRARLSMKGLISEWGGTRQGILYALAALGYERSYIEPFSLQDPDRWAEFIVFLSGTKQSGVNNIEVIDAEVRKVKEGSSKPAYGMDAGNALLIRSQLKTGLSWYPQCGEIVCGVFPRVANVGYLFGSVIRATSNTDFGEVEFPKVGTVAASKKFYQPYAYVIYEGLDSDIGATARAEKGTKQYMRCSPTLRCSAAIKP